MYHVHLLRCAKCLCCLLLSSVAVFLSDRNAHLPVETSFTGAAGFSARDLVVLLIECSCVSFTSGCGLTGLWASDMGWTGGASTSRHCWNNLFHFHLLVLGCRTPHCTSEGDLHLWFWLQYGSGWWFNNLCVYLLCSWPCAVGDSGLRFLLSGICSDSFPLVEWRVVMVVLRVLAMVFLLPLPFHVFLLGDGLSSEWPPTKHRTHLG